MSTSPSTLAALNLNGAAMHSQVSTKNPDDCSNMQDVRAGVDAVDAALVALLAKRFAYMDAAARIKSDRDAVRDESRKREVIANAVGLAEEMGVLTSLVADFWEQLVEASIAYEFEQWDIRNKGA